MVVVDSKEGQKIVVADRTVKVTVLQVLGKTVRLGFSDWPTGPEDPVNYGDPFSIRESQRQNQRWM